jgi:lysophospholipase L1-like esterase
MSNAKASGLLKARKLLLRALGVGTIVAVSGVVALLGGEVLVRLVAPQQLIQIRPDLWMPADSIGWLRRPNVTGHINTGERTVAVRTDREGFRVGVSGRKEAATQVLLLGDSFIEALQVEHEQSVAHLLETRLEGALGRSVAVRNAGTSGWSPNHYLIRTRQLLATDTFRLVVVALFAGNDAIAYREAYIPPREPVARNHFRLPRRVSWGEFVAAFLAPTNDALEVRSHLFILLKNQMATVRMRLGITADYLPVEYRKAEAASPRWRNTAELSRELAEVAETHGARVLFVLIPERFQVYPDEFQRYLRGFGIDSSAVDVDQPSKLLLRELSSLGLNVVDVLPAFRAAPSDDRLYGTVDQHLSPEGHQVLTNVIAPLAARAIQ